MGYSPYQLVFSPDFERTINSPKGLPRIESQPPGPQITKLPLLDPSRGLSPGFLKVGIDNFMLKGFSRFFEVIRHIYITEVQIHKSRTCSRHLDTNRSWGNSQQSTCKSEPNIEGVAPINDFFLGSNCPVSNLVISMNIAPILHHPGHIHPGRLTAGTCSSPI